MPLQKLKNYLSVRLALDSVLQIRELVFQLWQLHSKKLSKTVSETCTKWLRFGTVSETWGLAPKCISTKHFVGTSCHRIILPPLDGFEASQSDLRLVSDQL